MTKRVKEGNPLFDMTDRGYNVKAWYVEDIPESKGDALVEITKDDQPLRSFIFPAYKIYNIAAHFQDIVDGEIEDSASGYELAASTGLEGLLP